MNKSRVAVTGLILIAFVLVGIALATDKQRRAGGLLSSPPTTTAPAPQAPLDPIGESPTGSRTRRPETSPAGDVPSARDQQIYTDVSAGLSSNENPAKRPIPKNLLQENRDEKAFEEWTMETMSLGIEYQQKIFKEVGKKYGLSPELIAEIHARVYDWRQMNDLSMK